MNVGPAAEKLERVLKLGSAFLPSLRLARGRCPL